MNNIDTNIDTNISKNNRVEQMKRIQEEGLELFEKKEQRLRGCLC